MTHRLRLPESEISLVRADAGQLHIRLSAASAVDQLTGTEGFLRGVNLVLDTVCWQGEAKLCFGKLVQASVKAEGARLEDLPAPGSIDALLQVTLEFRHGEALSIRAKSLRISVDEPLVFVESYAC